MTQSTHRIEGWHSRATPHPDPRNFTPQRDALAFGVLRNARADPEGFTLAVFSPNIAVDAAGRVLILSDADFSGFVALAKQTLQLPPTGSFMNAWRIAQVRTEQPIERLFVPGDDGALVQTSVQGYERGKTELKIPVGDVKHLPPLLQELFGYISEARDHVQGTEEKEVINRVKLLLEDPE